MRQNPCSGVRYIKSVEPLLTCVERASPSNLHVCFPSERRVCVVAIFGFTAASGVVSIFGKRSVNYR